MVTLYRQVCDTFLEQIDNTVKLFNDLDGNFKFVEERTKAMQTACEKLLEEQVLVIYLFNYFYFINIPHLIFLIFCIPFFFNRII